MKIAASICLVFALVACDLFAAEPVGLRFREQPIVEGQVVRFGDLLEFVTGLDEQTEGFLKLPLAPAPRDGTEQSWTRADVIQHLELRGLHSANIRWYGTEQVSIRHGKAINGTMSKDDVSRLSQHSLTIPSRDLSPAFVQERAVKQAELLLRQAITEYVTLQTGDRTDWQIDLSVPPQHAQTMQTRSNIVSIGGGKAPWEGPQEFVVEIKDRGALVQVPFKATLKLPPMIVVCKRPLRKDEVITAEALDYAPVPKRSTASSAEYFANIDEIVGKQLRRSVSSGLAIEASFVGEPIVITRGELIEVESVAGSIVVKTSGRAVESGAVGALIGVELIPSRKRVFGTVSGPLKVKIAAIGARSET